MFTQLNNSGHCHKSIPSWVIFRYISSYSFLLFLLLSQVCIIGERKFAVSFVVIPRPRPTQYTRDVRLVTYSLSPTFLWPFLTCLPFFLLFRSSCPICSPSNQSICSPSPALFFHHILEVVAWVTSLSFPLLSPSTYPIFFSLFPFSSSVYCQSITQWSSFQVAPSH